MAKKAEMDIIGYNYQQERSFDTLETAAGNSGNGGMMNAGMGLSMVVLSCVMLCVQSELITNLS